MYDWLRALKEVNPLYANIVINESLATAHAEAMTNMAATLVADARIIDDEAVCNVETVAQLRADDVAHVRNNAPEPGNR